MLKICEDCLLEKPEKEAFYQHPRTGAAPICKSCTGEANKLRREDPEAYKTLLAQRRERRRVLLIPNHKPCRKCLTDKPLSDFREKAKGLYGRSSWCLECECRYTKAYVSGLKREEILDRRRKQWATNPRTEEEKASAIARSRGWYQANKARHQEGCRARYAANPEPSRLRARVWAKDHPERSREIVKRWKFEHPERARHKMAPMTLLLKDWGAILEMFDHRCAYCFRKNVKLTVDHVVALTKGGAHSVDNVVPACKFCNSRKYNRPVWVMLNVKEIYHGTPV